MKRLSAALIEIILLEFGSEELLRRIADPHWFQAMGCVVGFDWHSSGVTTTLCGALKEGLSLLGDDVPIAICGGKAKRAIQTPQDISAYGEKWSIDTSHFISLSRLCAKIDNTAVQDGYSLYHHTFIFTKGGEWAIVQQGMNDQTRDARRYQWLSKDNIDLFSDPHSGITCDSRAEVINYAAKESEPARIATIDFTKTHPDTMAKTWDQVVLSMPKKHQVSESDYNSKRLHKMFQSIYEAAPGTFKDLIEIKGVGPRTMSALALVSELVYNAPPRFDDPARFSFAHGGKDGYPFPVDKKTYEHSIDFIQSCVDKAKLGDKDKIDAFRRLSRFSF